MEIMRAFKALDRYLIFIFLAFITVRTFVHFIEHIEQILFLFLNFCAWRASPLLNVSISDVNTFNMEMIFTKCTLDHFLTTEGPFITVSAHFEFSCGHRDYVLGNRTLL